MWCRCWCLVGWIEAGYVTPSNKSRLCLFFWPSHFLLFSVWISFGENIIFLERKGLFHPNVRKLIEYFFLRNIFCSYIVLLNYENTFNLVRVWSKSKFPVFEMLELWMEGQWEELLKQASFMYLSFEVRLSNIFFPTLMLRCLRFIFWQCWLANFFCKVQKKLWRVFFWETFLFAH